MISKEALHALRERFPRGTRVELVKMDDPQAPPVGTKGTVLGVDDIGLRHGCLGQRKPAERCLR